MKGPIVFLVSLLCVAAVGYAVLLPRVRERDDLRREVLARAPAASPVPAGFAAARDRLARIVDAGAPASFGQRLRRLVEEYAAGPLRRATESEIDFAAEWARVPALLDALANYAGRIDGLKIEAGEEPARCRVVLRLDPDR
jgi:hypothetical protein